MGVRLFMILVLSLRPQLSGVRLFEKLLKSKLVNSKLRIGSIMLFSWLMFSGVSDAQFLSEQTMKLDKALRLIDSYYVDSVDRDGLVEDAIISMLKELDPHSVYITKDEVKKMNEPLVGNFEGIGVQFNLLYDTIFIISPISGGPSEKLGILPGDRIIYIDGENVAGTGISTNGVRDRLLGKKGTKVKVEIMRRGEAELLDFTIVRDKIPIYSLDAAYMMDEDVGYMRFNRFSATTMNEMNKAVEKLQNEGMQNLILDLRKNGGGLLDAAVKMADEFLGKGKLIVYMKGSKLPQQDFTASSAGKLEEGRLIILVDEGSASSSEIVTGAIQDWDRGLVIGRRSFGKGLVQRPFYLTDGSMIRLTIARYYTPSGRLIQRSYKDGYDNYLNDFTSRYASGELMSADSIVFPDSLRFQTKINKRTVYGGGGIMPDIFIPIDTTVNYAYYNLLAARGIINNYVLSYVDGNRSQLEKIYKEFKVYRSEFIVDDSMIADLLKMADKKGLPRNESSIESSGDQLKLLIKALIARDIWDMSEYFEMLNTGDETVIKALEIINNSALFDKKLAER